MPSAMGRSKPVPPFRTSAGARLTVIRCGGKWKPEFRMAVRTRSRLSLTLVSGRPTRLKLGNPYDTSTSTTTGQDSSPKTVAVRNVASIAHSPPCKDVAAWRSRAKCR